VVANLDRSADHLLSGLTGEPAWPTLRGHLLRLAASGVAELFAAVAARELTSAHDQAAVIDSRIPEVNRLTDLGPLRWLPGIPHRLAAHPNWGPYLRARSQLVAELADQVRRNVAADTPAWAAQSYAPGAGRVDRRHTGVAGRHRGRPPATCDPPGQPNAATPPASSNSNSTNGSPPRTPAQTGGGCSR
jgi:hypothetical protein